MATKNRSLTFFANVAKGINEIITIYSKNHSKVTISKKKQHTGAVATKNRRRVSLHEKSLKCCNYNRKNVTNATKNRTLTFSVSISDIFLRTLRYLRKPQRTSQFTQKGRLKVAIAMKNRRNATNAAKSRNCIAEPEFTRKSLKCYHCRKEISEISGMLRQKIALGRSISIFSRMPRSIIRRSTRK